MLHSLLFAPFPNPAHHAWFEQVRAALPAQGEATLLLGNLQLETGVLEAVVIRPRSITVLHPAAGPAAAPQGPQQFGRTQHALAQWLGDSLSDAPVQPEQITGLLVGAGAAEATPEPGPTSAAAGLLPHVIAPGQLPAWLQQLARPGLALAEDEFAAWWQALAKPPAAESPAGFWEQKARQLWRWLGAEDIPHDAPYGGATAVAASQEEKLRLEQLRQHVRDELQQQRQQLEAREAEREHSMAQLRAQLQQLPAATAEVSALQARLAAETREKQQLEAAMQAARAEAVVRNQELDARIQQLSHLIRQLQAAPPQPAAAPAASLAAPAPGRAAAAAGQPQRGRPAAAAAPRPVRRGWLAAAVVALAVGAAALGIWGLQGHLSAPARPAGRRAAAPAPSAQPPIPGAPSLTDIQADTLVFDDAAEAEAPDSAPVRALPTPRPDEVMDSAATLPEGI